MSITGNAFPISVRFVCDLNYELSMFALSLSFAHISSFCLSGDIIDLSGFFYERFKYFPPSFALCINVFNFSASLSKYFFSRILIMR